MAVQKIYFPTQQGEISSTFIKEIEKRNSPRFMYSTASVKHKIYIQLTQQNKALGTSANDWLATRT